MATNHLTERHLRAAQALLAHGERVEVRFIRFGVSRECFLLGAGREPNTVRLAVWCEAGETLRNLTTGETWDGRAVRMSEVALPMATLERIEAVAMEQESGRGSARRSISHELRRALEFAEAARTRRAGMAGAR